MILSFGIAVEQVDEPPRERMQCAICHEEYADVDTVVVLRCNHHFHQQCTDYWCAARARDEQPYDCPLCRSELIVDRIGLAYDVPTTEDRYLTPSNASQASSVFPISRLSNYH